MEIVIKNNINTNFKYILLDYNYEKINNFLKDEDHYPFQNDIFNCFNCFNKEELKYVIIGQDPYLGGLANGLAFACSNNIKKISPSLRNILKEINNTINTKTSKKEDLINLNKDLNFLTKKGVLLLNSALTVNKIKSGSHLLIWKEFTEYIINKIDSENISFFLWGNYAQNYKKIIKKSKIYECGHPSPLNRKNDFIGNSHFNIIFNLD